MVLESTQPEIPNIINTNILHFMVSTVEYSRYSTAARTILKNRRTLRSELVVEPAEFLCGF